MASSQGIPEDIKQQLAKKEADKEKKEKKSDDLVAERKKLEDKLLETSDKDLAAKVQASIDRIEGDIAAARKDVHDLNEQIKLILGKKKKEREKKKRNENVSELNSSSA